MRKKILVVTGDGGEGYEAWYAVHRFQEEGFEPVVAAPSKRRLSICHGIQVLVGADILKGRTVTCYEPVRTEVEIAGGSYDTNQAHRDGHIVSAQTWESHPEFFREIMNCLRES